MCVDTQGDILLIKVIDRVEMLQENVTEQEVTVVVSVQGVLSDRELTDAFALVKVGFWRKLEEGLAYVESYGFCLVGDGFASLKRLAEGGVRLAV